MIEDDFKQKLQFLNLNKKSFAEKCGISESAVKKWFKDGYKVPKYVEVLLNNMVENKKYRLMLSDLNKLKKSIDSLNF